MEINGIVKDIFGLNLSLKNIPADSEKGIVKHSRVPDYLNSINEYIADQLSQHAEIQNLEDDRDGRIGPCVVQFDYSTHQGVLIMSPDRLSINSRSNFSTMRANTAVYKGKWMYELQLGSKGVMQIGWSTAGCKYTQESGVGDTVNSYAYDGNRVRKWNMTAYKYGEPWLTGDIIGCALDMDEGNIYFYRNGRNLGRAFENISRGAGFAYFPAVSLAFAESLTANFGSTRMRYPIEGYEPLQAAPEKEIKQATCLFNWFFKVVELININTDQQIMLHDESMSLQTFLMCLSRSILKHIGPLMTVPYIAEHIFIPFIQQLSESEANIRKQSLESTTCSSMLSTCLDLLWTFLEKHEIKACLKSTVSYLLSTFRHVSLLLEYPEQCRSLLLLTKICQHSSTRQYLLQHLLFNEERFANFMHVKPLDEGGLANIVNNVWWEMDPTDLTIESNKASYLDACEKIKIAISEVEELQVKLLVILLNDTDGNEKKPSSRAIFLKKLKHFVLDNFESSRTPLPITLGCFHRLLEAFKILWTLEVGTFPVYMPCRVFYDASIDFHGTERLGGVLSYLTKTFKKELLEVLPPDHEVIVAMDETDESVNTRSAAARLVNLPVVIYMHTGETNGSMDQARSVIFARLRHRLRIMEDRSEIRLNPVDSTTFLLELLNSIILFYHVIAKRQLARVAILRNNMLEYISALQSAKASLNQIKNNNDPESQNIQQELLRTISVFSAKLTEQARYMAWTRAAVYSEEKQLHLAWLLRVITLTLTNASKEGNLFSFVPDFYLESLADLCVSLRNHVHPITPTEKIPDYQQMFIDIAEFLCEHFMDPRIVNANSKETLLLTLARFVFNKLTLEALENVTEVNRVKVVTNLLKSYENRAWAESNWILVRFWQGNGFAFRYEKSPHLSKKFIPKLLQQEVVTQFRILSAPCPSAVYQNHVRDVLLKDQQATAKFLNSLLNQLNWAFSEFINMVQEVHNVSSRSERTFIETNQLKMCATCFDLTVSLLRVLEMIVTVALNIFNDPSHSSNKNLLSRLCQFLCQVLNRMSSQTSCFQQVVLLEIPDLDTVDHFPLLAAVTGILLALLDEDMQKYKSKPLTEVPKITQTLLIEPSFQMSSLYFMLDDTKHKIKKEKIAKSFSFSNYPDDVTEEEIEKVKCMIEYLEQCCAILPDSKTVSEDDNTCTICYAYPVAATFKPCNHQTCRICIERHLLNARECFFCKATIEKVVDIFGNTLHDFTNENSTSTSQSIGLSNNETI